MKKTLSALTIGTVCLVPVMAGAHISIASSGIANSTQEVAFNVGHGCEGSDTYSIKIDVPDGVTGLRVVNNSDFATVNIEPGATTGTVKSVTFVKAPAAVLPADTNFYKLVLRFKVPNAPFTTLLFPTHQVCRTGAGAELPVVDWVQPEGATTGEPAPTLKVVPARKTGWNKITVPVAVADVSKYLDDAQIVWKGSAAYSPNAATTEQIKATAGVTELKSLAAGDEIWVKY